MKRSLYEQDSSNELLDRVANSKVIKQVARKYVDLVSRCVDIPSNRCNIDTVIRLLQYMQEDLQYQVPEFKEKTPLLKGLKSLFKSKLSVEIAEEE